MIQVAVTDDDVSVDQSDILLKLHEFHQQFEIPVSYFIVPFQNNTEKSISQDTTLQKALDVIRNDGSEAHPHSHRHHPFEWGYPEISGAMEFSNGLCKAFADHRFAVEEYQSKDRMFARMGEVVSEWEAFSGEKPRGFRPGWGSFSSNLYAALAEFNYEWSSTRFASRSSWHRCMGHPSEDVINERVGLMPYMQNGLVEYPILGDFGFHANNDAQEGLINLFKQQFQACIDVGAPCVLCHHPHGLEAVNNDPGSGYAIYTEIFQWLQDRGDVEFVTMSQLHNDWQAKALPEPALVFPEDYNY